MARTRAKTRVEHLADGLVELNKASKALHEIDLRTAPTEQRVKIKGARESVAAALQLTTAALQSDDPARTSSKIAV